MTPLFQPDAPPITAMPNPMGAGMDNGDPENPMAKEMRLLYKKPMKYNNNVSAIDTVRSAAQKMNFNPSMLLSSAFQEGLNKAIVKPDEVSEAYVNAKVPNNFPVDGFRNYGLDRFGDNYQQLKKYLPEGFDKNFQTYSAKNEKGETVNTAAFNNDESALMAKAAMLKDAQANVRAYAKKKGLTLDDNAANYFTLAAYNSGQGNAQKMLDDYANEKDKKGFIQSGGKNWQKLHANINPRLQNMQVANELLNQTTNQ